MLSGYIIIALTIAFSIIGIYKLNWDVVMDGHNALGMIVFVASIVLLITGFIARKTNLYFEWKTKLLLRWAFLHKVRLICFNMFRC